MLTRRSAHPGAAILDAVAALPGPKACNAVYAALSDKTDLSPEDLEILSNRLGRLAHERARALTKRDLP